MLETVNVLEVDMIDCQPRGVVFDSIPRQKNYVVCAPSLDLISPMEMIIVYGLGFSLSGSG